MAEEACAICGSNFAGRMAKGDGNFNIQIECQINQSNLNSCRYCLAKLGVVYLTVIGALLKLI